MDQINEKIQEPKGYFYFVGHNSAMKLNEIQQIKADFKDGISAATWVNLEQMQYKSDKERIQILLTIFKNDGGGIEIYFVQNQLYFRIIPGGQYIVPDKNTKALLIADIPEQQWNFIAVELEGPKYMGKSTLNVLVNNSQKVFSVDFPKIINQQPYIIFDIGSNFCGKIASFIMFSGQILTTKLNMLQKYFKFGFQEEKEIQQLTNILEKHVNKLLLILSPIRYTDRLCYDMVNHYIVKFEDNSGCIRKINVSKRIQFIGGIKIFLPLLYLQRFCQNDPHRNAVNEFLKLLVLILDNNIEVQQNSAEINIFNIISNCLFELGYPSLDSYSIELLHELNRVIEDKQLIVQFFEDFLWNDNILDIISDYQSKIHLINFIFLFYQQYPTHLKSFGIRNIMVKAKMVYDAKKQKCCQKHCQELGIEIQDTKFDCNFRDIIRELLGMIEKFTKEHEFNHLADYNLIFQTFIQKCSPCFHLEVFELIKRILKKPDRQDLDQKILCQTLLKNKFQESVFYLFCNTPCIELKEQCLEIQDIIINQKSNIINHFDNGAFISSLIMKLNQQNNFLNQNLQKLQQNFIQNQILDSPQKKKNSISFVTYQLTPDIPKIFQSSPIKRKSIANSFSSENINTGAASISQFENIDLLQIQQQQQQQSSERVSINSTNSSVQGNDKEFQYNQQKNNNNNNQQQYSESNLLDLDSSNDNYLNKQQQIQQPQLIEEEKNQFNIQGSDNDLFNSLLNQEEQKEERKGSEEQQLYKNKQNQNNIDNDEKKLNENQDLSPLYNQIIKYMVEKQNLKKSQNLKNSQNQNQNQVVNLLDLEDFQDENKNKIQEQKQILILKNINYLSVIMALFSVCSDDLRMMILQDLINLLRSEKQNCIKLIQYFEFQYWLLDILLEQLFRLDESEIKQKEKESIQKIWNDALIILKILINFSIQTENDGCKIIQNILLWQLAKQKIFEQTAFDKQFQTKRQYFLRIIFQEIVNDLKNYNFKQQKSNFQEIVSFQTNVIHLVFMVFEIILQSHDDLSLISINPDIDANFYTSNILNFEIFQRLLNNQLEDKETIDEFMKNLQQLKNISQNNLIDQNLALSMIQIVEPLINIGNNFQELINSKTQIDSFIQELISSQLQMYFTKSRQCNISFMKTLLFMFYICLESANEDQEEKLRYVLDLYTKTIKNVIFCSEFTNKEQFYLNIIENDTDIIKEFQYKQEVQAMYGEALKYLYERFLKSKNPLFFSAIEDILKFSVIALIYIDDIYGNYDYFIIEKMNLTKEVQESGKQQINFILHEIFHCYLLDNNFNSTLNSVILQHCKQGQFDNFKEIIQQQNFILAYTNSQNMLQLINRKNEKLIQTIKSELYQFYNHQSDLNLKSFKMNDDHRNMIIKKQDAIIYDITLKFLEQEDSIKKTICHQNETKFRWAKNQWKKIWKGLRIYNGPYRFYKFVDQSDQPFKHELFDYEKMSNNVIFYHKIDKYEMKERSRPFYKLKLIEPKYVQLYEQKLSVNRAQQMGYKIQKLQQNQNINMKKKIEESKIFLKNLGKNLGKGIKQTLSVLMTPISQLTNLVKKKQNSTNNNKQIIENFLNDQVVLQANVQWIKTLTIRFGTLTITQQHLIFIFDQVEQQESHIATIQYHLPDDRKLSKQWKLEDLSDLQIRTYMMRQSALEAFFIDGQSLFFNFVDKNLNEQFIQTIALLKVESKFTKNQKNYKTYDPKKLLDKSKVQKKWKNKQISNFKYLMYCNSLASRSYKDIMQYPVFPWIYRDYQSKNVDFSNKNIYRDLTKNMGRNGTQDRIQQYNDRFSGMDISQGIPPFHFGSHYSSPAIIYQLLIRIHPFSEGAKILQNGKFDIPDRLFYCLVDSFKCATEDISDVRELCPDFYSTPEVYLNFDKLEFGVMQNKYRVHNVQLPQWCDNNPYKFVYYQRKALENYYCSETLNNWIDLIFGYQQRGKEAEKAMNVYYYMTYDDQVELDNIEDESVRFAVETQIINFGQTPAQILNKQHPQRTIVYDRDLLMNKDNVKLFKPTSITKKKKKGQEEVSKFNLNLLTIDRQSIVKLKWVNEQKLIGLRRNGQINYYKFWNVPLNPNIKNAIPFQFGKDSDKFISSEKLKSEGISLFDDSINSVDYPATFIDDCRLILLGGFIDGSLKILNIEDDSLYNIYYDHSSTITQIVTDKNEKILFTGTISGDVIQWKIIKKDKEKIQLIKQYHFYDHEKAVTFISLNKEMRAFATSSLDHTVNLYNLYNGVKYRTFFHPNNHPINNVILVSNPVVSVIIFSNDDSNLISYSINGVMIEKKMLKHKHIFNPQLLIDNDFSEVLVYATEIGTIIIRELPFLEIRQEYFVNVDYDIYSMVISPDQKFLLCGSSSGEVLVLTDTILQNKKE